MAIINDTVQAVVALDAATIASLGGMALADSAALVNVGASTSSVTIASANSGRNSLVVVNDSTAVLYLKYGSTASSSSYTYKLGPGDIFEMSTVYTGIVTGIWASVNGNARVTEI